MSIPTFRRDSSRGSLGRLWVLLFCFNLNAQLFAHDPGLSVATARLEQAELKIQLALSPPDVESLAPLDSNHDKIISPEELLAAQPQLEKIALAAFEVRAAGQLLTAANATVQMDNTGAVQFKALFPRITSGALTIRSGIINRLARGHRQFFSIRDQNHKLLGEAMLDTVHNACVVTVAAQESLPLVRQSFRDFLVLGIRHIATGYDHILFLLGLLIVGGSLKSALKIITAFTVAHSLTLALATMNLITISPRIIEPLIAVSIIYVGAENILHRNLEKRWLLAFGFGLVHGCGFATALRDLGIGADGAGIGVPLVAFNLGVEMCQLTIAALVLPLIWKLNSYPQFGRRFVPASSAVIAVAGTWWLVERTLL